MKQKLAVENKISIILEEGPQKACRKRLMTVDETHAETAAFDTRFSLPNPLEIKSKAMIVCI